MYLPCFVVGSFSGSNIKPVVFREERSKGFSWTVTQIAAVTNFMVVKQLLCICKCSKASVSTFYRPNASPICLLLKEKLVYFCFQALSSDLNSSIMFFLGLPPGSSNLGWLISRFGTGNGSARRSLCTSSVGKNR